jgi:hypothetical protein
MANPTTNYGFVLPTPTDLVTDLPADFEVALQGVDTQMKTNADATISKTIVDAKGDLIAATAADTVARLAVGTNNQVLIADSTAATGLKWGTPAAGGMTSIATGSLSGTTTTISGIAGTYKNLNLVIFGARTNGTPTSLRLRVNSDTGASNYNTVRTNSSAATWAASGLQSSFSITGADLTSANHVTSQYNVEIRNYTDANYHGIASYGYCSENADFAFGNFFGSTSAITAINITSFAGTGSFINGTYILYGVN